MATPDSGLGLLGRQSERSALDVLVSAVRAGRSQTLVLRGDAGVGKSALLRYVAERGADCRMLHAVGVEAEMELAYAGLHQLCAPLFDRLEPLPAPQGDALATAFGLQAGAAPDRFLVSLAVLSLLGEAAEARPVICLVGVLVAVVPATSDVNPADADVAVSLHISLIEFDAAGDFLAFSNAVFTFVVRGLLRLYGFIFSKF